MVRGDGAYLWDDNDQQYLDGYTNTAVTGHCHPQVSQAISLQADKLLHVSQQFHCLEQDLLATKFCSISGMDKVAFCTSGLQANGLAMEIARLKGHKRGISCPVIATTTTIAANNVTLSSPCDIIRVNFNDLNALGALATNENVVAVFLQTVHTEVGLQLPEDGYLQAVRALCDEHDWLMILDENHTAMGRTGHWFAYQHYLLLPDLLCCGEALANGLAIGACAVNGTAAMALLPSSGNDSITANTLACRAARQTIEVIDQNSLLESANDVGAYLKKQLQQQVGTYRNVANIRAMGMLLLVELEQAVPDLKTKFAQAGLIVDTDNSDKYITLLPALILSKEQAKLIARTVRDVINQAKT
jgi:acetylornithine/N-succinyldiaminopimelate aminotransferase